MKGIHQDIIRQLFTLILIIGLGLLIFWKLLPFMSGLLGAVTIYIVSKKSMRKLVERGWKKSLAAALIMIISFVGILVPIGLVVLMLSTKVRSALDKTEQVIAVLKEELSIIEERFNIELFSSFNSKEVVNWVSQNAPSVVGNTFNLFITLSILYFLLYYMLVHRNSFIQAIYRYFPMRSENIQIKCHRNSFNCHYSRLCCLNRFFYFWCAQSMVLVCHHRRWLYDSSSWNRHRDCSGNHYYVCH